VGCEKGAATMEEEELPLADKEGLKLREERSFRELL